MYVQFGQVKLHVSCAALDPQEMGPFGWIGAGADPDITFFTPRLQCISVVWKLNITH